MYLSDDRLQNQLERLEKYTCLSGLCNCDNKQSDYRFPFCSSFLRPTDGLQSANEKLISSGEHLPICKIKDVKTIGARGGERLEYKKIKEVSVSSLLFEELFNRGKIGSRELSYEELKDFYENSDIFDYSQTVLLYVQGQ